jgi:hypothetical protein
MWESVGIRTLSRCFYMQVSLYSKFCTVLMIVGNAPSWRPTSRFCLVAFNKPFDTGWRNWAVRKQVSTKDWRRGGTQIMPNYFFHLSCTTYVLGLTDCECVCAGLCMLVVHGERVHCVNVIDNHAARQNLVSTMEVTSRNELTKSDTARGWIPFSENEKKLGIALNVKREYSKLRKRSTKGIKRVRL